MSGVTLADKWTRTNHPYAQVIHHANDNQRFSWRRGDRASINKKSQGVGIMTSGMREMEEGMLELNAAEFAALQSATGRELATFTPVQRGDEVVYVSFQLFRYGKARDG